MAAFVILFAAGLFFVLFGGIIWYFKLAGIIAGYDAKKTTDPDGLAKWIGRCMIVTGLCAWVIGIVSLCFASRNSDTFAFVAFMVSSMISGVVTLAGAQRFNR